MKNKIFLIAILNLMLLFLSNQSNGQAGEWVWIKGDSIPNQPGNYGVQGVSSPANNPPALYEPCEWTDLDGNFWLFGGSKSGSEFGDLWKYDPVSNIWTWMKGTGNTNWTGIFGTIGIPALTNRPPCLGFGMASWTDLAGDLWLFGGDPLINTLWKYNIATNMWTWMNGSSSTNAPGVYGTPGIPSPANTPGARSECSARWRDKTGNLWLFGGFDGNAPVKNYNDMWKYDVNSNQWTWMKGDSVPNQTGVYGTLGIPDPANKPGARFAATSWTDPDGTFWLFGGKYDNSNLYFNDLWSFNPLTNTWTWMGGTNMPNDTGVYGALCISDISFLPASRKEGRATWADSCGNLWMYGGGDNNGFRNDLWNFSSVTLQWELINGGFLMNVMPVFGSLGIPSSANQPGGRWGSIGWQLNNNLFLFGGNGGVNDYNDLWKYIPDTNCGGCNVSTSITENDFINEVQIFPNPTTEELTIIVHSKNFIRAELSLTNLVGEQVLIETVTTPIKKIKINNLSSGIYFLQITVNGRKIIRKVEKH